MTGGGGEGTGAKGPGDTSKRKLEKEQEVDSPGLEKGRGVIRAQRGSQSFQDRRSGEVLQRELDFQASGLSLKVSLLASLLSLLTTGR